MAEITLKELTDLGLCGPDALKVRDYISQGYGDCEEDARQVLDFVNDALGECGVAEVNDTDPDGGNVTVYVYVNNGDTYKATFGWIPGKGFVVAAWGDVYEAWENEHCKEGYYRCAYCGEWQQCGEAVSAADEVYNCESYYCESCCKEHCGCGGGHDEDSDEESDEEYCGCNGGDGEAADADEE